MKILIVRTIAIEEDLTDASYNNQGIGLATELSKLGHEVGLVYYAKKGKGFIENIERNNIKIKVYHIEGKNIIWNAIYNKELYDICKEYDIIQPSECDQIASYFIYKRFPNKTIVYHGPYKSKYTVKHNLKNILFYSLFLNKNNYKKCPVITKSFLAEKSLRDKGFENVITLGVGLDEYNFKKNIENIPEEINRIIKNKKEYKYILFVGAISKRKNLKFVLKVLDDIVNNHRRRNYKLIIVGSKDNKEKKYYNDCFEMIEKKGLKHNVIYLGKIKQELIKIIYSCCDVYTLPTQYDIFGMVYLEAMYFGVPIITTICAQSSNLIKNNETGYICDLNVNQWTNHIIDLCDNIELNNKISSAAKKLIKNNYLWGKLAKKFEAEYKKIGK